MTTEERKQDLINRIRQEDDFMLKDISISLMSMHIDGSFQAFQLVIDELEERLTEGEFILHCTHLCQC